MAHDLISTARACSRLGVSRTTFDRYRAMYSPDSAHPFPEPIELSARQFLWDGDDFDSWLYSIALARSEPLITGETDDLLSTAEVSEALKIRPGKIYALRTKHDFPDPAEYIGGRPVWIRGEIVSWVHAHPLAIGPAT